LAKSRSLVFKLCDEYFEKTLDFDAISSTYANKTDQNHHWNDYSFYPVDPFVKVAKSYHDKISKAKSIDSHDELAKKIILRDIESYLKDSTDFYSYSDFGSIYSEPQSIFDVFEVMPKGTRKDILNIIKRMEKIPSAFVEWTTALNDVARLNVVNAKDRVRFLIDILDNYASGSFQEFARGIDKNDKRLMKAAKIADASCEQLSAWLEVKYMPMAKNNPAVGKDRYLKNVKEYSGLDIDPLELYRWGIDELNRINVDMWELSKHWGKFNSLTEVRDYLNDNPKYYIDGREEFKSFLEGVTKKAVKDLSGTIFTIPVAMRKCEVKLDDNTIDESPYYESPSDDMTRPGRTVYPTLGRTRFTTWENYSTWFHESVPGHHMQIAYSILNKETLTRYQREHAWNSGYGEGWALYSERLMDELGYFEDPGYKMGYLMCQAMRAARLVVDIGLHLEYTDPYEGNVWNFDSAVKFMEEFALLNHDYAVSEVKRYLSWAGQAITYKIGEKVWLEAREDAKKRLGDKFDLKKFHNYALKLGPMGLDILQDELFKWNGK
jgi:uncharacterized protein (DUF885 family)